MARSTKYKNNIARVVLGLIVAIGAIGVLVYAMRFSQDLRSKASTPKSSEYIPPRATLTPPYVRLAALHESYERGQPISIDIYAHTEGKPSVETFLHITYDPNVLSVADTDIVSEDVYPVSNIESAGQGQIIMSLFGTVQAGYEPIRLSKDTKIASITFHSRVTSSATSVELVDDGQDLSAIFAPPEDRQVRELQNILSSTENVTFSIK